MDQSSRSVGDPQRLEVLLRQVDQARAALRDCRGVGVDRGREQRCRAELVSALREYAAAAAATGRPMPYRLRDELRLYSDLPP